MKLINRNSKLFVVLLLALVLTVLLPVHDSLAQTVSFGTATNFTVGSNPISVAIGDLNGDGKPDLAVANAASNNVSILLGNSDGTFGSATNYTVGSAPLSVAIGDLNGDRKPDLVVVNGGSSNVSILLGNGDGTFGTAMNYSAGSTPFSVAIGDLNGDGKADLAVVNEGVFVFPDNSTTNIVSILLGNGDGTFSTATNYPVGITPLSVAIGDLNGDGKPDLAVANEGSSVISILLGNGDGTFGSVAIYSVMGFPAYSAGSYPTSVAIGDLNGDGKPDLAVANSSNVSVLLGNGDGTFGSAAIYSAGTVPWSVAIMDLNGDTKPDLAVANEASNNVSVVLGNGDGTFGTATNYSVGPAPLSVAIGDLNGDGKPDLAVANSSSNSNNVSILLNTTTH